MVATMAPEAHDGDELSAHPDSLMVTWGNTTQGDCGMMEGCEGIGDVTLKSDNLGLNLLTSGGMCNTLACPTGSGGDLLE